MQNANNPIQPMEAGEKWLCRRRIKCLSPFQCWREQLVSNHHM